MLCLGSRGQPWLHWAVLLGCAIGMAKAIPGTGNAILRMGNAILLLPDSRSSTRHPSCGHCRVCKGRCPPLGLASLSIPQQTRQQQGKLGRAHPSVGCGAWRCPQLVQAEIHPPGFPATHLCGCLSLQEEGTRLGSAGDLLCSSALQVVELFKVNAAKGARCYAIGVGTLLYGITHCPSNSLKKTEAK